MTSSKANSKSAISPVAGFGVMPLPSSSWSAFARASFVRLVIMYALVTCMALIVLDSSSSLNNSMSYMGPLPRIFSYPTLDLGNLTTWSAIEELVDCNNTANSSNVEQLADFFSDEAVMARTNNCDVYFAVHGMDKRKFHDEPNFSLAFSHMVHMQIGLLDAKLAAIFHPDDAHCIHVDAKADPRVYEAALRIIGCYNERFPQTTMLVASNRMSVHWGQLSVLEADQSCMRELLEKDKKWRVFVNTAGTELPLKPLPEFRHILANLNESNAINHFSFDESRQKPIKPKLPFKITFRKGSRNMALSREMCKFVTRHPVPIILFELMRESSVPDEHFYTTLATVKNITKGNNGPWVIDQWPSIPSKDGYGFWTSGVCMRRSLWYYGNCHGKNIRAICNFGKGDLETIRKANCLWANKFNLDVDMEAPFCQMKSLRRLETYY